MQMSKAIPDLAKSFANLLWANTPQDWQVSFLYHQNTLFVSVVIGSGDDEQKMRRNYPYSTIKKRKKDLWGLAYDCSEEIVRSWLKGEVK